MATLPFVVIGLQGRHYPIGLKIANPLLAVTVYQSLLSIYSLTTEEKNNKR